ncbi:MAG: GAF domain-containing protein [Bacteroidales bacterium]|nr:GAF domain-containing protein [Bacteroidales bacterium]
MGKEEKYQETLASAESLLSGESDMIAGMANLSSLLHEAFGFFWTGFYRVCGDELILGPFQGPLACTRIPYGKGVCGCAWQRRETVVVPDVEKFPGHIACSSLSRSEIVVPVWKEEVVVAVLDIDSKELGTFDEVDRGYLEKICRYL